MTQVEIYKLGGASVKDAAAIRNAAAILIQAPRPLVVVISAMGKMTNHLEKIIHAHYSDRDLLYGLVEDLKRYHEDIARELLGDKVENCLIDLHDLWVELNWILEEDPRDDYNYQYDQVIVFGELASTRIVSAYLANQQVQHQWMDARSLIKTDNAFREGRIDWELTQRAVDSQLRKPLDQHGMIVTQGFIGSTVYNESTSLGREGSDYTAAVLAYTLDAKSVSIWKDVPGIMTGDPKRFADVQLLSAISYQEAIEMTYYGAKVIHPKTVKPLQNKNIPLLVRPFDNPTAFGTIISNEGPDSLPPIVVVESNQSLIRISTRDFSFVAEEHLQEIFTQLATHRLKVNSMQNTALSFLVCITRDDQKLVQLMHSLKPKYDIEIVDNLELITVRHGDDAFLSKMKADKVILFEEQVPETVQFIVKS
jgi:aspartate kinase